MTNEHIDVLIVGAGLSGVGAACRLQTECPGKTWAILEGRDAIGGTWDLYRYPGVRADSDAFTLSYPFRPWPGRRTLAEGSALLRYIRETAAERGVERGIRFRHRVVAAAWSSQESRWTVEVATGGTEQVTLTCDFLFLCTGYYSYQGGHRPGWPGLERFAGPVIDPQQWPSGLDWTGQQVVVIGSGATAVTLVPAMAGRAGHVTMVQRSPSWVMSLPEQDAVADLLRKYLPPQAAHYAARWKNLATSISFYSWCQRWPSAAGKVLRARAAQQLPPGYPVDPHFTPRYGPWDQRLCAVPGGDLFRAVTGGKVSIETGRIAAVGEREITLESGRVLPADIIVSATGLRILMCGGIRLTVDGEPVEPGERFAYRGCLLSGVPNLSICIGYINNSWTLRADLTARYVCRLLNHMDRHGYTHATPKLVGSGTARPRPILDLTSNYVERARNVLPKQGARAPWRLRQNYVLDAAGIRFGDVTRSMSFARCPAGPRPPAPAGSTARKGDHD